MKDYNHNGRIDSEDELLLQEMVKDYPTEKLSSNNCAAYFRLLFYIPLQHIGCHNPNG